MPKKDLHFLKVFLQIQHIEHILVMAKFYMRGNKNLINRRIDLIFSLFIILYSIIKATTFTVIIFDYRSQDKNIISELNNVWLTGVIFQKY